MSDPAWASRVLIDGAAGLLSVQDAATVDAPGTADEIGFVTEVSAEVARTTNKKGPWLNYRSKKTVDAGKEISGEFTVDLASGVDAVMAELMTAVSSDVRKKLTFELDDGPTYAFDQCLLGFSLEHSAEDGISKTFTFEADSYVFTAAS